MRFSHAWAKDYAAEMRRRALGMTTQAGLPGVGRPTWGAPRSALKVEAEFAREGARRDVVSAAERGEKVVERFVLVRLMTVKRRLHL